MTVMQRTTKYPSFHKNSIKAILGANAPFYTRMHLNCFSAWPQIVYDMEPLGRDELSCAWDGFYRKSRWLPRAAKCFSDSIMGGSVCFDRVGGFVPILPRAAHSQHHPRVSQAEHLNIFASLIETGIRRGEGSICLLFPLLLMSI